MKQHGAYSENEARTYDSDRAIEPLWHAENTYVASLVRSLAPRTVLDVPVGTGRFLGLYDRALVEGIDLSDAMLAEAAERVFTQRLMNVTLRQGSVTALPFADQFFDLVVCWRLLHLLPVEMLVSAFREMARVSNGHLCVQVYERAPLVQRSFAWSLRWLRRLCLPFVSRTQLTPWSHITSYAHTRSEIEAAAEEAGLGTPMQRTDLGGYESTRVLALVWRLV